MIPATRAWLAIVRGDLASARSRRAYDRALEDAGYAPSCMQRRRESAR